MKNLRELLEIIVNNNKNKEFIYFEDRIITYNEFNENVNRIANAFLSLNIKKGDKVCIILSENTPDFLYLFFGLLKIGAISAFVNAKLKGMGLSYLINKCDAKIAIIDENVLPNFKNIERDLYNIEKVICYPKLFSTKLKAEMFSYSEMLNFKSEPPPLIDIRKGDTASLLHTAGSTGPPKWCIISHNYYMAAGECIAKFYPIKPHDIIFNPLPFYHANPQVYFIMGALIGQATMIITRRFSVSKFWEIIDKYKPTIVQLHPAIYKMVFKHTKPRSTSIKIIFPADREIMEKFNIPVGISLYGSTEAGAVTNISKITLPIPDKLKSLKLSAFAGKSREDMDVRIFNNEDNELPPNQIGEIVVRPKKPHIIFDGYYNDPQKTVKAWRNLWFHTGDVGYKDEFGNLIFLYRKEESISVKGEFVHIGEVEEVLMSHPKVLEAAIVGVPGEYGEEVKAYLRIKEGEYVTPEEIILWCKERLPKFMIPRYIEFIKEFPRVTVGKINKIELKRKGIGKAWDRVKEMGW